jgi:hypothetical protein
LREVARLSINGQRLNTSDPEIQSAGKSADRLDLLHLGIVTLFAPEGVGKRDAAFEGQTLPEL